MDKRRGMDCFYYIARTSNHNSHQGEPSMEAGDTILVSAHTVYDQNVRPDNPCGYLYGQNYRTGEEGFFPGELIAISFNNAWLLTGHLIANNIINFWQR